MGQRYVQLKSTFTAYRANNSAILHVNQLPPNPAIIVPGPAFIFVVVKGVPSIGLQVMLGSGQLGVQTPLPPGDLPAEDIINPTPTDSQPSQGSQHSSAAGLVSQGSLSWTMTFSFLFASFVFGS